MEKTNNFEQEMETKDYKIEELEKKLRLQTFESKTQINDVKKTMKKLYLFFNFSASKRDLSS